MVITGFPKSKIEIETEIEGIGLRRWSGYDWSHWERGLELSALSLELISLRRFL